MRDVRRTDRPVRSEPPHLPETESVPPRRTHAITRGGACAAALRRIAEHPCRRTNREIPTTSDRQAAASGFSPVEPEQPAPALRVFRPYCPDACRGDTLHPRRRPIGKGHKAAAPRQAAPPLGKRIFGKDSEKERQGGGIKRGCPKRIRQPLSESGFRSFLRGPTSFLQPQIVTRERKRTADQCAQEIEYLGRHPAP